MPSTALTPNESLHPISRRGEPTWGIAHLFPTQGNWSEGDYLALETNHLVELADGWLEVLPMPDLFHQLFVGHLSRLLDAFVVEHALGRVLFAPLPIRLWPGNFREPDIMYFESGHIANVHLPPNGADLVVEIVSEGDENRKRDLETKRDEYARAGIREYWIVDPQEQHITVLTLDGTAYRVHGVFGPGQTATSVLLPGFTVSVNAVLAAGEGK
jgi:Uma2 family endonuclease